MKKLAITAACLAFAIAGSAHSWVAWGPVYEDYQLPVPIWGDETTDLDDCSGNTEYLGTAKRAYITWNQVTDTKFSWTIGGWGGPYGGFGDGFNNIRFKEINDAGVLGLTVYNLYNGDRDADVKIDLSQNWECGPGSPWWNEMDLESVILHEAGHQLGLGHSSNNQAVMWWAISMGANKRDLHSDDINGIRGLYPN